jgi:hypothetical protein
VIPGMKAIENEKCRKKFRTEWDFSTFMKVTTLK